MQRRESKWRVQWTAAGKRKSRTFESQKAAERFRLELRLGIADPSTGRQERATFAQLAERFLRDHVETTKAPSQWAKDRGRIKNYLVPAFGQIPIENLRQSHLLKLKADLVQMKAVRKKHLLSKNTANHVLTQAKTMMRMALAWDLVGRNPWGPVKLYKLPEKDFDYWSVKERDSFEEKALALDPAFTRLVVVAAHTGLRRGELAALRAKDLSFKRETLLVRESYDLETEVFKSTKGGEIREVPMNERVKDALSPARFLDPKALVFDLSLFVEARKRLFKLSEKVGVSPIRFHDLRHTFASHLAIAGVDLLVIQKLLGHKSYQMTLRYARLRPDHLAGATDVLCTKPAPENETKKERRGPTGT